MPDGPTHSVSRRARAQSGRPDRETRCPLRQGKRWRRRGCPVAHRQASHRRGHGSARSRVPHREERRGPTRRWVFRRPNPARHRRSRRDPGSGRHREECRRARRKRNHRKRNRRQVCRRPNPARHHRSRQDPGSGRRRQECRATSLRSQASHPRVPPRSQGCPRQPNSHHSRRQQLHRQPDRGSAALAGRANPPQDGGPRRRSHDQECHRSTSTRSWQDCSRNRPLAQHLRLRRLHRRLELHLVLHRRLHPHLQQHRSRAQRRALCQQLHQCLRRCPGLPRHRGQATAISSAAYRRRCTRQVRSRTAVLQPRRPVTRPSTETVAHRRGWPRIAEGFARLKFSRIFPTVVSSARYVLWSPCKTRFIHGS